MMNITGKDVFRYTVMPEVKPRLQSLFISGFQHIPYFMALVYNAVRLLPPGHPYLNPANVGQYGVRHVIAEAANNLVLSRENIDQILLFITMLTGVVLVCLQLFMFVFSITAKPVRANMPTNFAGFFLTPEANAPQDIAYIFLDMTFGVPDLFGSCVDPGAGAVCQDYDQEEVQRSPGEGGGWILGAQTWPYPIHHAMHQTFQLYSMGLLVVATMITLYFIATIIIETAQTGTAFGKRFNKVWAPVRIVMAFGLLIPVGHGLNSAQYIVLYAAKFGSGFATNGWIIFNEVLNDETFLGRRDTLVSTPNIPEVGSLLQFMYVAKVCQYLEQGANTPRTINAYLVGDPLGNRSLPLPASYDQMIRFADGAPQVIVRFGEQNSDNNPGSVSGIAPVCGELSFPLADPRIPGSDNPPDPGPEFIQTLYWQTLVNDMWVAADMNLYAQGTAQKYAFGGIGSPEPDAEWKNLFYNHYKEEMETWVEIGIEEQVNDPEWEVDPFLITRGWAAAGVWYNKLAQLNGAVTNAALNIPNVSRYPDVMERVLYAKKQQDGQVNELNRFEPVFADGGREWTESPEDNKKASALWHGFKYWQADGHATSSHSDPVSNPFIDAINKFFGTEGLFSMRDPANRDIHPLAQLVGIGRSLIESAIMNLGLSAASGVAGAAGLDKLFGISAETGISFFMTIATIGLTVGFVMFYIVPFLPFIYFFFAVGGWIKGIFEAMVGAPLWALAHIRIDGPGLPGKAAINGYFLIFEIFVRPILIIFGLLASVTIFSALVATLNEIWDLVTYNVAGFDPDNINDPDAADFFRSPVDELFFTVVYAVVVYLMGMSSFKLIDLIPNNILRWMGSGVEGFNDKNEDSTGQLVSMGFVGGDQVNKHVIGGGLSSILKGIT